MIRCGVFWSISVVGFQSNAVQTCPCSFPSCILQRFCVRLKINDVRNVTNVMSSCVVCCFCRNCFHQPGTSLHAHGRGQWEPSPSCDLGSLHLHFPHSSWRIRDLSRREASGCYFHIWLHHCHKQHPTTRRHRLHWRPWQTCLHTFYCPGDSEFNFNMLSFMYVQICCSSFTSSNSFIAQTLRWRGHAPSWSETGW